MTDQAETIPDYSVMNGAEMLQALGVDAMKWAQAFNQQYPAVPVDEAMGWFANAMMAMWDQTNSAITHDDELLVDHISQLVRNRDTLVELDLIDKARQKANSQ